jgi:hypothetical protein
VAEGAARAGGGLFDRLQQNRPPGNGGNGGSNDDN